MKILVTSSDLLDWCSTGKMMDLRGLMDPNVCSKKYEKDVYKYFGKQ